MRHLAAVPATPRVPSVVELSADGVKGSRWVRIDGEIVGRIGAPWWGQADREEHQLFTAHLAEVQVGDTRGMTLEEARRAVIDAWARS